MIQRAAAVFTLLLAACAPLPSLTRAPDGILHDELFAAPTKRVDATQVFALSDPMRKYLRDELAGQQSKGARQVLIDAVSQGQLKLEYDSVMTRNAAEAFDAKAGNCLSLVIMTAAFAKAMNIEVTYNSALFGDQWSRDSNVYFLNGHVNVTLGRRPQDPKVLYDQLELMTVDFLPGSDIRGLKSVTVGEDTILAMFMNNRAAEALVRGKLDDAYWLAREGIRQNPEYPAVYNTLGVVYLRHGNPELAEPVFRRVLQSDPSNTRALANLALTLGKLGREAEAAAIDRQLARAEGDAPFHHFNAGLAAMEAGDFKTARNLFRREVRRAPEYHEFHFWLGLSELRLGNIDEARGEFSLALEASTTPRDHDLYASKLARLSTLGR
ncbi:MAG: tetratricopeptide repeat protein [Betaproteobacteria bacterium]|nr:tetratricopeptide repeat protein [Betaproteobacteria bacterium]